MRCIVCDTLFRAHEIPPYCSPCRVVIRREYRDIYAPLAKAFWTPPLHWYAVNRLMLKWREPTPTERNLEVGPF